MYFVATSYIKLSKERQSATHDTLPGVIVQIAIYAEEFHKDKPFVFYNPAICFVRVDIRVEGQALLLVAQLLIFVLFAETSYLYHSKPEL